jgi:hypothetical protein
MALLHYDGNVLYRRINVSNLRKWVKKLIKWWRCRGLGIISFRTEKLMTSDGRSKPQLVLKWSTSNPKIYYRWGRRSRTDVKFGIMKTIIFLLAGYSLSYMYVDENKTNQNKYYFVHTCCIRTVIYIYSAIYPNAEIIYNPTFPSALGSNWAIFVESSTCT